MSLQEPVRTTRAARRSVVRPQRPPLRTDVEVDSRQAEREVRRDVRAERMLLVKATVALALSAGLVVLRTVFFT